MNSTYIIKSLNYQRNGVGGESFFQLEFDLIESGQTHSLIAVIPQKYSEAKDDHETQPEYTYVIDPENMRSGWRGDRIGYALCGWVDANQESAWPTLYPEKANVFPVRIDA